MSSARAPLCLKRLDWPNWPDRPASGQMPILTAHLTLSISAGTAQNRAWLVDGLTYEAASQIRPAVHHQTRFEAWVVIYAIALGAVERASAYLALYPGWLGWMFAAACTGVVFVAGSKLLDSVTVAKPALAIAAHSAPRRAQRNALTRRSRPRLRQSRRASR